MTPAQGNDLVQNLAGDAPELAQVLEARDAIYVDAEARRRATQVLQSLPAEGRGAARRGFVLFALGREAEAAEALASAGSRAARLVRARALCSTGRPRAALASLGDWSDDAEAAAIAAECHADLGETEGLEGAIRAVGKAGKSAEATYLRGRLAEITGERAEARKCYEEAGAATPPHARALFRRAVAEAAWGDEDAAVEFYRRAVELPCPPVNAFLNLGCLYEDRGEFSKARDCYHAILGGDAAHTRARMFEKDVAAALNMFYDEDLERRSDKRAAILRLPVTDFELSVRSRNCLAKMGVRTLGDLVQKSEAELLSYKNFGETSLQEIKDVLAQKGLRLGMSRDDLARESQEARSILEGIGSDADRRKLLQKPLSDLELSVRSRHCMNVLGLKSVGELCAKSEAELMTIKNFGQTSLNEVKQKLAELGLGLAPSPPV